MVCSFSIHALYFQSNYFLSLYIKLEPPNKTCHQLVLVIVVFLFVPPWDPIDTAPIFVTQHPVVEVHFAFLPMTKKLKQSSYGEYNQST
jgi:hypothetical protein